MALRTIDRLLLLPALIVLGSLTVTACATGPDNNSSSSSRDDRDDEKDDEEEDEEEETASGNGCPPDFVTTVMSQPGSEGGEVAIIDGSEFTATAVGAEYLDGGCFISVDTDVEGVQTSSQIAYLHGGTEEFAAMGANLEAAGYEKISDGIYSLSDTSGIILVDVGATASADEIDQIGLGFGSEIVMVMTFSG